MERKIVEMQHSRYVELDQRLHKMLDSMTDREISLTSVSRFAKDACVSRVTVYKHREVYERLTKGK